MLGNFLARGNDMKFGQLERREFIALTGGAAAAWPLVARAQPVDRMYRLAILTAGPREAPEIVAIFDELRLSGFIEGQNLTVDGRGFRTRDENLSATVAEIIKSGPDAIVSTGPAATRAAQAATTTIPILANSADIVGEGLARSLANPGANTTGVSLLAPELDRKRQGILMEAVPGVRHMAALADPKVATQQHLKTLIDETSTRGIELSIFLARTPEEIAPEMERAKASGAEAINVLATPMFFYNRRLVIERAAALRLPAMYEWPEMAEDGGLMGYGPRLPQWFRDLARLLVKVLRGSKPADLPIEQPSRFELVINLKTANALGLEVPPTLLARADEVIE
jgi:putative tryptophan/tyrosine transport system substrate-binding protein